MLMVFVVSDATGETAERVVRSALVQFESAETTVVRRGHVRTEEQVRQVVAEAVGRQAVILLPLVSDHICRRMLAESRGHGDDSMDLMGLVPDRVVTHMHLTPREMPGTSEQLGGSAPARDRGGRVRFRIRPRPIRGKPAPRVSCAGRRLAHDEAAHNALSTISRLSLIHI